MQLTRHNDAALLDDSIEKSTARVTSIAAGSRKDADMETNMTKTHVMQVGEQGNVSKTTDEKSKKMCKFTCKNVDCDWVFHDAHGAR